MNELNDLAPKQFDKGYKLLHWLMTVLIFLMFLAKFGFASAITDIERMTMLVGHSSMGTLICMLLIIRVSKRFIKKDPVPKPEIPKVQKIAAKTVQYALYFFMLFVPVSGYLTARLHELPVALFGQFNLNQSSLEAYNEALFLSFRSAHEFGITMIMVLLVLHIGAALFHGIVKKDGVMSTMVPWKKVD